LTAVQIYTTPSCPYCKKAKEFFKEHDVEYEEHDVADDKDRAREMIKKSGQRGVPVIVVGQDDDEEIVVGFNEEKLTDLLGVEA
jgi:glutaredoxin-like YruB-family protein